MVIFVCTAAMTNLQAMGVGVDTIAKNILRDTGVCGGVVVHLGCGDGRLTAALQADTRYVVHGLDRNPANVAKVREYIRSAGTYGAVSVDVLDGTRLPYVDNLINLVVTSDLYGINMAEVMRVLVPGGVAYVKSQGKWAKTVKAWPTEIDERSHYLHAADGNPVAQDSVVGPPKHYQWICKPLWMRSHESDSSVRAMVTAAGRLFYIVDDAPASLLGPHDLPDKWSLTARDAFNGVLLWKIPIKDWGWRAWKPSWFTPRPGGIPLNMPKRLVVDKNKVYVTLGYHAPVSKLDAKTGAVIKTYDQTKQTGEILLHDGVLVLSVLQDDRLQVAAIDAESGDCLWRSEKSYGGTKTDYYRFTAMHGSVEPAKVDPTLNTATDGNVVALLDGGDVVCLDFETGKEKWHKPFPLVQADYNAGRINAGQTLWVGTLIVSDSAVIHASPNQMAAFSSDSGMMLWQRPKRYLQHLWFEWKDVFVIDGLVWTWSADIERGPLAGSTQKSMWPVSVNGYDLHTGELKKKVDLGNIFKTHHHHRCYRNKATTQYILASRRGTEFIDLLKGEHTMHNWVRGICHLGMMPANGLQYVPPHPCECYIEEKLKGFNALAPARSADSAWNEDHKAGLLKRGPAFGNASGSEASGEDWPTFRCDMLRSGSVKTTVPSRLRPLWRRDLGDRIGA
jgi:SAM-dependent methyltransferase